MKHFLKSTAVLLLLLVLAIPTLVWTVLASIRLRLTDPRKPAPSGRTVLLTGGKMTKCLQLARLFHAMGDRVIVAETRPYQYCGTRFSKAVDQYIIIPKIKGAGEDYRQALIRIAQQEQVDLFVPVASPKAAFFDALAKPDFPEHTEVFHFDADIVKELDDKHRFCQLAKRFGLSAPESHLITSREQLLDMTFADGKRYILKKIDYDPVYRLDLRTLPHRGWEERVRALPISEQEPWVLQEFLEGKEVCTHTTTRDGEVKLYVCSDSSPFQVNYAMLHLPAVRAWVDSFVQQLGATGQISFDFIIQKDDQVMPIECNPRTHSAITVFHDQPTAATAYYPAQSRSLSGQTRPPSEHTHTQTQTHSRSLSGHTRPSPEHTQTQTHPTHTYWLYHELHRILRSDSWERLNFLFRRVWTGKEAVFDWKDPWPFWFNNHVGIPYQIVQSLRAGTPWTHIDFNIGKLAIPGGD